MRPVSGRSCGWCAVGDDGGAGGDHGLRNVGVVIEAEQDGDFGSEQGAAERGQLPFHVVGGLGRAGAVELQREAVEPACGA